MGLGGVTTAQRESDLFTTSMITNQIGRQEFLLLAYLKNYHFREKGKLYIKKLIKGA